MASSAGSEQLLLVALDVEQLLFEGDATAEPHERPIRSDDPVTRQDDGNRVLSVDGADGTERTRLADGPCLRPIADGLSVRDIGEGQPGRPLKLCAVQPDGT